MENSDINNLCALKFNLEKCISCSDEELIFSSENKDVQKILKDLKEIKIVSKVNDYVLSLKYIMTQINSFLEKNCNHEWIHDTVEYGKHCFIGY